MSRVDVVLEAIKDSVQMIRAAHPGARIRGYALLTDDSCSSLSAVACSEQFWTEERDLRYCPVEWPLEDGASAFDSVSSAMSDDVGSLPRPAAAHTKEWDRYVTESFGLLHEALERAATAGLLSGAFVVAVSTDPGPFTTGLTTVGVRRLNGPRIGAEWADYQ